MGFVVGHEHGHGLSMISTCLRMCVIHNEDVCRFAHNMLWAKFRLHFVVKNVTMYIRNASFYVRVMITNQRIYYSMTLKNTYARMKLNEYIYALLQHKSEHELEPFQSIRSYIVELFYCSTLNVAKYCDLQSIVRTLHFTIHLTGHAHCVTG